MMLSKPHQMPPPPTGEQQQEEIIANLDLEMQGNCLQAVENLIAEARRKLLEDCAYEEQKLHERREEGCNRILQMEERTTAKAIELDTQYWIKETEIALQAFLADLEKEQIQSGSEDELILLEATLYEYEIPPRLFAKNTSLLESLLRTASDALGKDHRDLAGHAATFLYRQSMKLASNEEVVDMSQIMNINDIPKEATHNFGREWPGGYLTVEADNLGDNVMQDTVAGNVVIVAKGIGNYFYFNSSGGTCHVKTIYVGDDAGKCLQGDAKLTLEAVHIGDGLGELMKNAKIKSSGTAGNDVGKMMMGGELMHEGSVGDDAGAGMQKGVLAIKGSTGERFREQALGGDGKAENVGGDAANCQAGGNTEVLHHAGRNVGYHQTGGKITVGQCDSVGKWRTGGQLRIKEHPIKTLWYAVRKMFNR